MTKDEGMTKMPKSKRTWVPFVTLDSSSIRHSSFVIFRMSSTAPRRPRVDKGKRTFQIVASQFNPQYVQGLVDHAAEELHELAPGAAISIHRVPGSFEIPVVVRELARKNKADAI